jgi:uncharacterized membrane protein
MNQTKERRFIFYVFLITLVGTLLRLININYSSLWSDELYSVLAIRPGSSLYSILFSIRALQPPGYFILLLVWVKIFAYNEFYARLLSVVGGAMAIAISAWLGRAVKGLKLGILMALISAFNPMQIWFSLEARFYIFVYFLAALSLLLYWHLRKEKPCSLWLYLFKGVIDASLCYFHHFGIMYVFAQALYDLVLLRNDRDRAIFFRMMFGYVVAAILYAPWVFWGLSAGLAVNQYWLKDIDVINFLYFNFNYTQVLSYLALASILWFIAWSMMQKNLMYRLFPFIVIIVVLVPVLYSLLRFPILVSRYAMVLGPVLYLMFGFVILQLVEKLEKVGSQIVAWVAFALIIIVFSFSGFYMSLVDKTPLVKQPWRQMAMWLRRQPDFQKVPVYAYGSYVNSRFNLDFYLGEKKQAIHMDSLIPGKDAKMYLVESTGVWGISDSVMKRVDSFYIRRQVPFRETNPSYGNIYVCERRQLAAFTNLDTLKTLTRK